MDGHKDRPDIVERRALRTGLTVSVLLHLFILLATPPFIVAPKPPAHMTQAEPVRAATVMRAYSIVPILDRTVESADAQVQDVPSPVTPPDLLAADETIAFEGANVGYATRSNADRASLANRLGRGRGIDSRLWVPSNAASSVSKAVADSREGMIRQLDAFNESTVPAQRAARRAMDWTFTSNNGRRWGFSPGSTSVGGITLPISLELAGNAEMARRVRTWNNARRQALIARSLDGFRDRVKAIRERKQREHSRRENS